MDSRPFIHRARKPQVAARRPGRAGGMVPGMATMHPNPLPEMPGSVRISDPGDLHRGDPRDARILPAHSLVCSAVVAVGDGGRCAVRAVMRHDLPDSGVGPLDREAIEPDVRWCARREDIEFAVVAVIVEDERPATAGCTVPGRELRDFLPEPRPAAASFWLAALVVPAIVARTRRGEGCTAIRRSRAPTAATRRGPASTARPGARGRAIRTSREELGGGRWPPGPAQSERARRDGCAARRSPAVRARRNAACGSVGLDRIAELAPGRSPHLARPPDLAIALSDAAGPRRPAVARGDRRGRRGRAAVDPAGAGAAADPDRAEAATTARVQRLRARRRPAGGGRVGGGAGARTRGTGWRAARRALQSACGGGPSRSSR